LLSDTVKDAAFRPGDIGRLRAQTLTGIAQLQKDPTRVANRVLPGVLFGSGHPYGGPSGGDPKAIARFRRADLASFQQRWLRPDNVKIFIVSDRPLSEVQPLLDARFGHWTPPATPKGVKPQPRHRDPRARDLTVNRSGAPQSSILGGELHRSTREPTSSVRRCE
jgi:predicted Zn-dependent peptidase